MAGQSRRQEGDHVGHVLRLGHLAESSVPGGGLDPELLGERSIEVGVDVARREGEGRDALSRPYCRAIVRVIATTPAFAAA